MYIHGDMTTAKFAVIENPRNYQFVGRWTDYTERFGYAEVYEVTRNFIQEVSWMTEDHPYVIHFCQNGIEDICDDTPDIETDGPSLLFAYDVFLMTRGEKSYSTKELIDYANNHYDYRYEGDNIYGFGANEVTVDDVDKGLETEHFICLRPNYRKDIYADALADYQKRIEENHRREERELKKAQREREEHQEVEREKRERAKREYEERVQRERAEREERERREREWRRRECEEREELAREERERIQRAIEEREQRKREEREREERREKLYSMKNDVRDWFVDIRNSIYTKQVDDDYSLPFVQFDDYEMKSIDTTIKEYFGTKFYDIVHEHTCYYVPKDVYNRYGREHVDEDVCVAQTTTLNLAGIPMGMLVDGVVSLFTDYGELLWSSWHRDVNVHSLRKREQLYLAEYKPDAQLTLTDDGILFTCGLVPHGFEFNKVSVVGWMTEPTPEDAFDWDLFSWSQANAMRAPVSDGHWLSYKTRVAEFIREWKQTHKHVIDRVRHNEGAWWSVDRLPFVNPKSNTNLLYVAYLPQTDVIKVGRTQNWESRENAYRRISGPTPETTGDMRLCYVYETPTVGDAAIDKWLLYCAEDHIKQFARERMELVGGNEFFRGQPVQDFCVAVDEYFKSLTTQDIICIRPEYEAKQFALQNNYHVERFLDALEQL